MVQDLERRPFPVTHWQQLWDSYFCHCKQFEGITEVWKSFIDGTFKPFPRPYTSTQFVTVHGLYLDRVFTLVMFLMSGKTVGQYRQVIQHLKQRVRHVSGHRWKPDITICDFEQGLILAIETELPNTLIKIQEVGLARQYRQRRRLRKIMKKIMTIYTFQWAWYAKDQPLDNW